MGRCKSMGLLNHSSDTHLNYLRPVSYFSPSWIPLRVHCQGSYSDWWFGGWQPVFLLPEFSSGYTISDPNSGWWLYGHNILCLLKWQTNSVSTLYIPTVHVCMHALCDPMDCSLPGSYVHGILQARILEWVAISSFRVSFQPRDGTHISSTGRQILYHWVT